MKSLSKLIASEDAVLAVQNIKDRSIFRVFSLKEQRILFEQTMPRIWAKKWSYSAKINAIASIGSEDPMVSIFGGDDGVIKSGFRVVGGTDVLLFENHLRVSGNSMIKTFDLNGEIVGEHSFVGDLVRDLGIFIISEINVRRYHLLNGTGEFIAEIPLEGLGVTSSFLTLGGLVVTISGGPTLLINQKGEIIWQKNSRNEYHPIFAGADSDNNISTIHAHFPTMTKSIFTVHSPDGTLIGEELFDICPPVATFCPSLTGWIIGSLETFAFESGKFKRGRIEAVRQAFNIGE